VTYACACVCAEREGGWERERQRQSERLPSGLRAARARSRPCAVAAALCPKPEACPSPSSRCSSIGHVDGIFPVRHCPSDLHHVPRRRWLIWVCGVCCLHMSGGMRGACWRLTRPLRAVSVQSHDLGPVFVICSRVSPSACWWHGVAGNGQAGHLSQGQLGHRNWTCDLGQLRHSRTSRDRLISRGHRQGSV